MDWIDEKILQVKKKLRMNSLRGTLRIYIMVAVVLILVLYILTNSICEGWENVIEGKWDKIEPIDKLLLQIIKNVKTYSVVVYSAFSIMITTNRFYKDKIQEPIGILKEEAMYIGKNDLSISCAYISGDELGEVCDKFEQMRLQLIRNQENLWNVMEGQRQLNKAFAHDLRTPLTVLQGYTNLLTRYYPQGKISGEKLIETLELMQNQLNRLIGFSEEMTTIQNIEARKIDWKRNDYSILAKKIKENANGITLQNEIKVLIYNKTECLKEITGCYDEDIILEVVDNLLTNALSFATSLIEITVEVKKSVLYIYVRDDGAGFSKKELYTAFHSNYTNRDHTGGHFGIGLAICKILCEKHGGKLTLSNSVRRGAIVCVSFQIR